MDRRKRIVEEILQLLACRSVTGDARGIMLCQNLVREHATNLGFETEIVAGGRVLVISPKGLKRPAKLGIVVHLDTVPYESSEWTHNPLGEISSGRIIGRGIIDDKGPITLAMHAFDELHGEIEDSWQIIVGSDEEGSWEDMKCFLSGSPILPEFLVTIDGDGVQNGCRGYMDIRLEFKRETDTNIIKNLYVPNGSNNTIPAVCVLELEGERRYLGVGKKAHSSIPSQGRSAITELATRVDGDAYKEYASFFDLLRRLDKTYDAYFIRIPDAEVSVTNVHMDKNGPILNLNVRMEKDIEYNVLSRALMDLMLNYNCNAEIVDFIRPSSVDKDSPEIKAMQKAYEEVMGKKATVSIARGVGYNAALPNCAIFGPRFEAAHDEEDTCHQANENRSLDDLFKFYDMLKIFVKEVL